MANVRGEGTGESYGLTRAATLSRRRETSRTCRSSKHQVTWPEPWSSSQRIHSDRLIAFRRLATPGVASPPRSSRAAGSTPVGTLVLRRRPTAVRHPPAQRRVFHRPPHPAPGPDALHRRGLGWPAVADHPAVGPGGDGMAARRSDRADGPDRDAGCGTGVADSGVSRAAANRGAPGRRRRMRCSPGVGLCDAVRRAHLHDDALTERPRVPRHLPAASDDVGLPAARCAKRRGGRRHQRPDAADRVPGLRPVAADVAARRRRADRSRSVSGFCAPGRSRHVVSQRLDSRRVHRLGRAADRQRHDAEPHESPDDQELPAQSVHVARRPVSPRSARAHHAVVPRAAVRGKPGSPSRAHGSHDARFQRRVPQRRAPRGLAHAPATAHRELEGLHPGPTLAAPLGGRKQAGPASGATRPDRIDQPR